MLNETQIKTRLARNHAIAHELMNISSGAENVYHLGRVVAIIQSWAEIFDLQWIEAEIQIRNYKQES